MRLVPPPIGPVLGLTTTNSARFMAGIQQSNDTSKLNCGWIRLAKEGEFWQAPEVFQFNRTFYHTGVIELINLAPGCKYRYQIAYEPDFLEEPPEQDDLWSHIPIYEFSTRGQNEVAFIFGSCLHNDDDPQVGKVFQPVLDGLHPHLDCMLWLGDQIHSDKMTWFTSNDSDREDFSNIYEQFFDNPYISQLLPRMPNYMVMDHHEIANDFSDGTKEYGNTWYGWNQRKKEHMINGIAAFYAYQASHGPVFKSEAQPGRNVAYLKEQQDNQVPVKHYAELQLGNCGVFLMDTRKERQDDKLVSDAQLKALERFLKKDWHVRFIVTSVTFLADNDKPSDKSDNWKRAAVQRKQILDFIHEKPIQNVVFLSGDVHSHFAAQLLYDEQSTTVYQLVSGSLFWPTSFMKNRIRWFRDDVEFNRRIFGSPHCTLSGPISVTSTDFYSGNGLGYVSVSDRKLMFKVTDENGKTVLQSELPLAP